MKLAMGATLLQQPKQEQPNPKTGAKGSGWKIGGYINKPDNPEPKPKRKRGSRGSRKKSPAREDD